MVEVKEKPTKTTKPQNKGSFYDLYILLKATSLDLKITELEKNIKELIEKHGGKIDKVEKFVKKSLAHTMNGLDSAYAASIYFWIEAENIEKIKNELKEINENFLRFMITKYNPQTLKKKIPTREVVEKLEEATKQKIQEKMGTIAKSQQINAEKIKEDKISIEDIDKKLDEIMNNL